MNYLNFHLLLDEHLDGALPPEAEAQCTQHAAVCAACAARRDAALQLQWALRGLPAAVADADFADRVLAAAAREHAPGSSTNAASRRGALRWQIPSALAASLALAIGIGAWNTRETLPEVRTGGDEPVRLVFRSASAVSDVTIELSLPEGVELAGFPGQRRLVWQSDLRAGENLLELPVRAHGRGGVVTATLNHGKERRAFSVRLVAAPAREAEPLTRAQSADAGPDLAARVPREAAWYA